MSGRIGLVLLVAGAALVAREDVAQACGGCFVPPSERTVVTDHRMAFSISTTQTVLWDQIRYSGDPSEFAWVLPVHPGARIELSHDEWFAALDASTQPVIRAPYNGRGNTGCLLGGCGSQESASSAAPGAGQVQVLRQDVVGPYETATIRATDPDALTGWLRSHAYDIPVAIQPTIDAYVSEGFDFIALRLRPVCNERSMKPVRIVTPGADPTLPLRMVAAGVGARVGITLYVIGEGRWHPQNFPDAKIDYSELVWDNTTNRSNYEELSQAAMGAGGGRSWLTEYAGRPVLTTAYGGYGTYGYAPGSYSGNPGLADAYFAVCRGDTSYYGTGTGTGGTGTGTGSGFGDPCDRSGETDAGPSVPPRDSGAPDADAGADGAAIGDDAGDDGGAAAEDAGTDPDSGTDPTVPPDTAGCKEYDDLEVATRGMHVGDVWITRLRAVLPADALAVGDLRLEATPQQVEASNVHVATRYVDGIDRTTGTAKDNGDGCETAGVRRHEAFGTASVLGLAALGLASILQRRRRQRR